MTKVKKIVPETEEDDKLLTYKMEINRLRKECTEWKALAMDRYIRMKQLSRKLALLKDGKDEEAEGS